MNIGIMTLHGSQNYGGVLQAYALQAYIKNIFKGKVNIINFSTRDVPVLMAIKNWKTLVLNGILILNYRALKRKSKRFERFRLEMMDLTRRYYSYDELLKDPPLFDVYISGSDQVFHPLSPYVEAFFLEFCPDPGVRKIAYAPSFGITEIPGDKRNRISKFLMKFDSLSAREMGGAQLIHDLTKKKVETLLDPVFLLNTGDWRDIETPPKKIKPPFILCYALVGKRPQMEIARMIKNMTGLPIVLLTKTPYPRMQADQVILDAGPREFIWLFDKAEYIVTDSFHGTAFSILFEKPFFIHIATPEKVERIKSLLKILDLKNRIIRNTDGISEETLEIDYTRPRVKLGERRSLSKAFLKSALSSG
jgi:hypothetical protein